MDVVSFRKVIRRIASNEMVLPNAGILPHLYTVSQLGEPRHVRNRLFAILHEVVLSRLYEVYPKVSGLSR
jgi:hypothetical protein